MKTRYLKMVDFCMFVERFSPFLLRDENGRLKIFVTYCSVYLYVMKLLLAKFPCGYVDLHLLLYEDVGLTKAECVAVIRKARKKGLENGVLPIAFDEPGAVRNMQLEAVMHVLHSLTGTDFHYGAFRDALCVFDQIRAATDEAGGTK